MMRLGTIARLVAAMALGLGSVLVAANAQTQPDNAQAGQVQTAAELNLGEQQISKIRKYFSGSSSSDEPVDVADVPVTVGAKVPDQIKTAPLPGAILVEMPSGGDYHYFLRGEDLVIVNADSRLVVAMIPNAN